MAYSRAFNEDILSILGDLRFLIVDDWAKGKNFALGVIDDWIVFRVFNDVKIWLKGGSLLIILLHLRLVYLV